MKTQWRVKYSFRSPKCKDNQAVSGNAYIKKKYLAICYQTARAVQFIRNLAVGGASQHNSMPVPSPGKWGGKPENSSYHSFKKELLPSSYFLFLLLLKILCLDSCLNTGWLCDILREYLVRLHNFPLGNLSK